jgi:hypothetical protein
VLMLLMVCQWRVRVRGVAVADLREVGGWNHFLLCLVNAFVCLM